MNPVAKRYAQAAYEAAIDNGGNDALANMVSGVEAFEAIRQESDELQRLVANPAFKEERDGVIAMAGPALEKMPNFVKDLRTNVLIPKIGQWTQQEAPEAVNGYLLEWLAGLN